MGKQNIRTAIRWTTLANTGKILPSAFFKRSQFFRTCNTRVALAIDIGEKNTQEFCYFLLKNCDL